MGMGPFPSSIRGALTQGHMGKSHMQVSLRVLPLKANCLMPASCEVHCYLRPYSPSLPPCAADHLAQVAVVLAFPVIHQAISGSQGKK